MIVSAIWAQARNGVIGKENRIPWHLPDDLKYFKRCTLGHHIITGRKNFESVGKPLPGRTNIIVTRNPDYVVSACIVVHSVGKALSFAFENGEHEAFIVGGGEIYKLALPIVDRLYVTMIDADIEGDVFAPEVDWTQWKEVSTAHHNPDERHKYAFNFKVYERKNTRV